MKVIINLLDDALLAAQQAWATGRFYDTGLEVIQLLKKPDNCRVYGSPLKRSSEVAAVT